jgi:hypothetical protein
MFDQTYAAERPLEKCLVEGALRDLDDHEIEKVSGGLVVAFGPLIVASLIWALR